MGTTKVARLARVARILVLPIAGLTAPALCVVGDSHARELASSRRLAAYRFVASDSVRGITILGLRTTRFIFSHIPRWLFRHVDAMVIVGEVDAASLFWIHDPPLSLEEYRRIAAVRAQRFIKDMKSTFSTVVVLQIPPQVVEDYDDYVGMNPRQFVGASLSDRTRVSNALDESMAAAAEEVGVLYVRYHDALVDQSGNVLPTARRMNRFDHHLDAEAFIDAVEQGLARPIL